MTATIRTLVIDDEPLARRGLRVRLDRESDVEVVGEAEDGPSAVEAILALRPDLVFLDVQMPGCDGFDVVDRTSHAHLPSIVFVTAFDHYALRAFGVHALDYLLKPITHRRFQEALHRVRAARDLAARADSADRLRALLDAKPARDGARSADAASTPPPEGQYAARLTVRDGDRFLLIRTRDVDWIEAAANYLRLHVGARTYEVRATMLDFERRLHPQEFARIHRSTIVNLDRIATIHPDWHGDYAVALTTGHTLRLSRRYRSSVLK
jgi:two-component system LytT family response regulator